MHAQHTIQLRRSNRPGMAGCAGTSIADHWISVEVQSGNTAVIHSTVVAVLPTDIFGSLLNDKVSIPAETQIKKICNTFIAITWYIFTILSGHSGHNYHHLYSWTNKSSCCGLNIKGEEADVVLTPCRASRQFFHFSLDNQSSATTFEPWGSPGEDGG